MGICTRAENHLRQSLLAIDNMARVCLGVFIFETFVDPNATAYPQHVAQSKFHRTTELNAISNWTGATTACYASWCKDAGFTDVYFFN